MGGTAMPLMLFQMLDWFQQFDDRLWLKDDDTGEEDARFLLRALAPRPGDRVLDIPCGAGRVAVHLARAGCRVTGIDRNSGFIARAKQRFAAEGVTGDFRAQDMRALDERDAFAAVYNWFGSFGYCSEAENVDIVRRMAAALQPGGRLLIEQPNREWLLRHFRPLAPRADGRNANRWIAATQRVETTWYFDDNSDRFSSSMRLYTPAQFRSLFARAGLAWETAYGGADGSPYGRGAQRIIVVGRK